MIDPVIDIKKEFELRFRSLLDKEPVLKRLILEIFVNGTAYVVGGI